MEEVTEVENPVQTEKKPPHEKYERWFRRDHLKKNLKDQSVKGGATTVGAQVINFLFSMASTVVLARLLLPTDFGLVAMVTAVTGFVLMFTNLGLGHAIVQRENINQDEVSQIFWLNMLIGLGLAILIVALAPLLVYFYDEPRLFGITLAYAVVAILGGLTTQHTALMRRQMKLKQLAAIKVWTTALSVMTGIAMALMGMGYWAIVGVAASNVLYNVIFKWIKCDWRPDGMKITKDINEYVGFGANLSGFTFVNYFSRNLDNVLIGKYIGSAVLGLYTKAYQLLMLPITQLRDPLNGVVIPGLSSLTNEPKRFRNYYRKYLFMLSFFSMPMVVFLGVCAYPVILLVLGEQWVEASEYFQLLAIVGFIQAATSTTGVVLISLGHTRRFLYIGIWKAAFTALCFVVGIQWGIRGLLIGYIVASYLPLMLLLWHSFNKTPIAITDFFKETAYPALYSILAGLASYLFYHNLENLNIYVLLVTTLMVHSVVYMLLWRLNPLTREKLKEVTSVGGDMMKGALKKIKPKR